MWPDLPHFGDGSRNGTLTAGLVRSVFLDRIQRLAADHGLGFLDGIRHRVVDDRHGHFDDIWRLRSVFGTGFSNDLRMFVPCRVGASDVWAISDAHIIRWQTCCASSGRVAVTKYIIGRDCLQVPRRRNPGRH